MNKNEVVSHLAEASGIQVKQVKQVLDSLADLAIAETIQTGEFVVPGIGKLVKAKRAARMGRNPATGESIQIAAKTIVKFKIAKAVKDALAK